MRLIEIFFESNSLLSEASTISAITKNYPYGNKIIKALYNIIYKEDGPIRHNVSHHIDYVDVTNNFLKELPKYTKFPLTFYLYDFIRRNSPDKSDRDGFKYSTLLILGSNGALIANRAINMLIITSDKIMDVSSNHGIEESLDVLKYLGDIKQVFLLNLNPSEVHNIQDERDVIKNKFRMIGELLLSRTHPYMKRILDEAIVEAKEQYIKTKSNKIRLRGIELELLKTALPSSEDIKNNTIKSIWRNIFENAITQTFLYYNIDITDANDPTYYEKLAAFEDKIGLSGNTGIFHTFLGFLKNTLRHLNFNSNSEQY